MPDRPGGRWRQLRVPGLLTQSPAHLPRRVLLHRIRHRTTNDYGRTNDQRAEILKNLAGVEPLLRATCMHEIDAASPIEHVVAKLAMIGDSEEA